MTGPAHPLATAVFVVVLAGLGVIDWHTGRLPDRIVLPMLWAGLTLNALGAGFAGSSDAILGAATGYATLWLISSAYWCWRGNAAFGGGDLKLAAMIGAWLGVAGVPAALFVAFLSGTCAVAPAIMQRRLRLSQTVPFGPALAFGGVVSLAAGPSLAGLIGY